MLLPCRVLQRTRGQPGKSDGGSLGLVLEMKRKTVMLVLPLNGAFTPHICGVSDRAGLNQRAAKLCLDNREWHPTPRVVLRALGYFLGLGVARLRGILCIVNNSNDELAIRWDMFGGLK